MNKALVSFLITFLYCLGTSGITQSNVPEVILTAFNQKFPGATHITWKKENAREYEAEFDWQGNQCSANFDLYGNWLETEKIIHFDQLPDKVQKAFLSRYPKTKVKCAARIETRDRSTKYEIEFKAGIRTAELFYTPEGLELKQ